MSRGYYCCCCLVSLVELSTSWMQLILLVAATHFLLRFNNRCNFAWIVCHWLAFSNPKAVVVTQCPVVHHRRYAQTKEESETGKLQGLGVIHLPLLCNLQCVDDIFYVLFLCGRWLYYTAPGGSISFRVDAVGCGRLWVWVCLSSYWTCSCGLWGIFRWMWKRKV